MNISNTILKANRMGISVVNNFVTSMKEEFFKDMFKKGLIEAIFWAAFFTLFVNIIGKELGYDLILLAAGIIIFYAVTKIIIFKVVKYKIKAYHLYDNISHIFYLCVLLIWLFDLISLMEPFVFLLFLASAEIISIYVDIVFIDKCSFYLVNNFSSKNLGEFLDYSLILTILFSAITVVAIIIFWNLFLFILSVETKISLLIVIKVSMFCARKSYIVKWVK
jgi:hypothetical protein